MKRALLPALIGALFAAPALAFDPFTVKDIRVVGIQRTEAGTVFSYLPVKVGDTMTDYKATQAVKALFATGFFKDVRLEIEGNVLVVLVEERPAIASIEFTGMKAFDKEQLKKGLRDVGLAESRVLDRSLLERAEQELKRQYLSKGYYGVSVTTTVTPLERNRVGVNFTVEEGNVAKIKQINIIGSKAYSEKDLLDLFVLRTPGLMTWYTSNDQYSKQKLSGDLDTLRSYYLDRGYLEFAIDSTQVSITPDKQDIYITINLSEGERYTVSSVKLAGQFLVPEAELTKLVKIKPGEVYSREKLSETTKAISERLGNEGYAFANVNAAPELDKEKHDAAFTIFIDPGRRVYVRHVNVTGNTRTRDEVVRREMRQMEASWYDGDRINKSKVHVDRLGYFEEVNVETPAVPGTTDQVDVNVSVKEKATGSLMVGAGLSSSEGLVLSGSIQQANLFGSGKAIGVQINTSKINTVESFSYTDPYYTIDGISRGFNIYHRNTNTSSLVIGTYDSKSNGGGVNYGVPIGDDDYVSFGLSVDETTLGVASSSPQRYIDYVDKFGDYNTTVLATAGWAKETIDSRLYPTKGGIHRLGIGVSTAPGSLRYYQATYQEQRFFPLSRDYTLMLNGEFGIANGYAGKALPFFKNFYAGGIGSVRGYESASLGKDVDVATGNRLGGNKRIVGNAEFFIPMPGLGLDKSMRLSAFVDGGQVWGIGESVVLGDLRYSTGIAFTWSSPMGPLKFSFARPLNKKPEDKLQALQFQMGTVF
jgi:outer membrane protein insertion porin family